MKISVALCTYNGEKFLQEQIDSILNQNLKVDEIIVCDDGSTDKTISILEKYATQNPNLFKIHQNEINLKSVKNFEKAIQLCTGDIIFLSDQDDVWFENKVEIIVENFENNKTITGFFSNAKLINEKNKEIKNNNLWNTIYFDPMSIKKKEDLFTYLTHKTNIVTGCTLAIKKEMITEILPFPEIENFHHDHWISLILASKLKLDFIDKCLVKYRIHNNQQVGINFKNQFLIKFKNKLINDYIFKNKSKSFLISKKIKRIFQNNITLFKNIIELNKNEKINAILLEVIDNLNKK